MKRRYFVLIATLLIVGISYAVFYSNSQPSAVPVTHTLPEQKTQKARAVPSQPFTKMTAPARFIVPSLGLNAPIESVGLTTTGDMAVPISETSLGWYEKGALPGNPGPAVLAGHTGIPDKPSPFRKFETLQVDDIVEIIDIAGTKATFRIIEATIYAPDTAPRQRIFGPTPTPQLTIITCSGTWLPQQNTYSHRLVLYATRIHPPTDI